MPRVACLGRLVGLSTPRGRRQAVNRGTTECFADSYGKSERLRGLAVLARTAGHHFGALSDP